MLIVISPAKTLDLEQGYENFPMTEPRFLSKSKVIMEELSSYDVYSLEKLMKISNKLAVVNKERNDSWTPNIEKSKQAILTFKGEVYRGMDAQSFTDAQLFYANDHLRMLSGLYGSIRPFDGIKEYRLEMGTKIPINGYKNLYDFWDKTIENSIIEEVRNHKSKVIVNLASKEYFKAIEGVEKLEDIKVIVPVFKELKGDTYKIITFKAKNARGLMTRYILQNEIEDIEKIKDFNLDGYEYNEEMSNDTEFVFTRE